MTLQIRNLSRRYGAEAALAGIDLDVADGEFLALLGPSGAGKTTLLRLIAGLDRPDTGDILIDGADLRTLAPRDRRIGFVFQNYALFRHMTVARNIAFGLSVKPRRQRRSRHEIKARVSELIDLMQLSGLGDRFPGQLSGGQRQRVALARALATDPQVLLLDEPFGALDARVRGELRGWLRDLQRRLRLTTIFVTHDQHEAFHVADRVAILNAGSIEQAGPPAEIRERPRTPFVRTFIGAGACTCRPITQIAIEPEHGPAAKLCPKSTSAPGDLPGIAAGDLWLMVRPAAGRELTSLEHHALTTANVIVYDRPLADTVAAVLPLGGYAEPTDGDGLLRSIQFVRDGWSVVRLIGPPPSEDRHRTYQRFERQLRDAGAFSDWRLRRLVRRDGRWLFVDDARLADPEPRHARGAEDAGEAIVINAPGDAAPDLYATACNGLAG